MSTYPAKIDPPSNPGWTLTDEGIIDGVQYVTVLTAGLDPHEYNITADEAQERYGLTFIPTTGAT